MKRSNLLQLIILAALGGLLLHKFFSGNLYYYINERFFGLVIFSAAGFLVLASLLLFSQLQSFSNSPESMDTHAGHTHDYTKLVDHHDHQHTGPGKWALMFVSLPVVLGLLIPARPLGAESIANRGIVNTAPLFSKQDSSVIQLHKPPNDRTVLDWVRLVNFTKDANELTGQPADVIGFVYQDTRLSSAQFAVLRYTVSCCVADAFAIGMIVNWPDADQLTPNMWVRVKGSVDVIEIDGQTLGLIHAESVQIVEEPQQPYLFP